MTRLAFFFSLVSTLLVLGVCAGCSDPSTGSPGEVDSGADPTDAASTPDTTSPGVDAAELPDQGTADPCGGCPGGTSCGTANGLPVCRDDVTGIPRFTGVFVVVMENMSLDTIQAATNTPYLDMLFSTYASGSDYHGVAHPSLPNYIAMASGEDVSGIGCDCQPTGSACTALTCNSVASALGSSCGCPQDVMHIGDQLEAAGLAWRAYGEDMGAPCNVTSAGSYAARHVPFLYFPNVQTDAARCAAHVVDYAELDLGGDPQAFTFIAPNLVHDGHDPFVLPAVGDPATNLGNADTWLSENIPAILASSTYTNGGLLVVVWDEDDYSGAALNPDDPIAIVVASPYARGGGYVSSVHADHYALLATLEDGLGLGRLGLAASAGPLTDYFPDN